MSNNSLLKRIELLIEREILANQTLLVQDLLLKNNPDYFDLIQNYYDESTEAVEEFLLYETDIDSEIWSEIDFFERLDLAQENGFEPQPNEIYEWWLVSDWLAEKLNEFEQPILETDYGIWWGRTTTGQAIKLDWVIQQLVISTDYAKFGNQEQPT